MRTVGHKEWVYHWSEQELQKVFDRVDEVFAYEDMEQLLVRSVRKNAHMYKCSFCGVETGCTCAVLLLFITHRNDTSTPCDRQCASLYHCLERQFQNL